MQVCTCVPVRCRFLKQHIQKMILVITIIMITTQNAPTTAPIVTPLFMPSQLTIMKQK